MVVLVRCTDDTITVAQESKLSKLIKDGLIKSYLRSGEWMDAVNLQPKPRKRPAPPADCHCTAYVSCF